MFVFSISMREYLEPVVRADQCAQCVDDIGNATNTYVSNTEKWAVLKCIRQAGLKFTFDKCHFKSDSLNSSAELHRKEYHHKLKVRKFPNKLRFTKSRRALQRYLEFVKFYTSFSESTFLGWLKNSPIL